MLAKLEKWLFTPAKTTQDKIQITATAFLTNMLWLFAIAVVLQYINSQESWEYGALFYGVFLAPLWEEIAFRVLPVAVARHFSDKLIIPVLGISSLLFGWGHGQGPNSLLIQGMGGVFLSVVYVKTNYSYWSVVGMHALWNFWLYFLT